jgi:two-component system sensor histidine kinase HydH
MRNAVDPSFEPVSYDACCTAGHIGLCERHKAIYKVQQRSSQRLIIEDISVRSEMMRQSRSASLRLRMIAAFLMVAVPPMLLATFIAAKLLSNAFDRNVQQWLTETANFISLEVDELMVDAERAAGVLANKIRQSPNAMQVSDIGHDVALMSSLGVDVVAIYGDKNELLYSSIQIDKITPPPQGSEKSLFEVTTKGHSLLAAGAIHAFTVDGNVRRILVGNWLDDTFISASQAVTSLEFEIFRNDGGRFVPVLPKHGAKMSIPPSDAVIQQLRVAQGPVYGAAEGQSIYQAVYAGLKASNGQLLGIVFVGLAKSESLFEQIEHWHLFSGIFVLGSGISIFAGLFMSGLLVRPLKALTEGVRSVSGGDYKKRVLESGGAEVEELASSFNTMAAELERLRAVEAELRTRERLSALGEAAVVIAHEVRNPLGIIKTSSELIRSRANLEPEEKRIMGYVIDEVNRIERLVHDFLDFAHPKPPSLAPIRLRQIVDRIADVVGPEFKRRGINFEVSDNDVDIDVRGDADQIYQACLNVVLNAMDALDNGGTIRAQIRSVGREIVLTIKDNGPGIPSELTDRIFNPFFTTKAKGTGLGLAKVQSVMDAHHGRVIYSTPEGGGAEFWLIFPPNEGSE